MLHKLIDRIKTLGDRPRPGTPPVGDPARAIVTYYFGDEPEAGVSKQWWWRTVDLALADDPEGPVTRVEVYLTGEARRLLRLGTNVPVRVVPGTRTITGIDAEAFEAETGTAPPPVA